MKAKTAVAAALIAGRFMIPLPCSFGQGSLTPPPGAPTPTMKTLDQVEARTIVNATNTPGDAANSFIISAAGSYYLAGNLVGEAGKHGISIRANDVTLDLNGFALISGGGGAVRGVDGAGAQKGFCIRNGTVRGWAGGGVLAVGSNTLAEKLIVSGNADGTGLAVGLGSLIKDCVANANGIGISTPERCQVINCVSTENSGNGFECASNVTLIDCTASRNFGSVGIVVQANSSVIRCSATRNLPGGSGIVAGNGSTIAHCTVGNNGNGGITAGTGCTIADSTVTNNPSDGITAATGSTVRGCTSTLNGRSGIQVTNNCYVIGNTCDANNRSGFNYAGVSATGIGNRIDGNSVTGTNNPVGGFNNGYGFSIANDQGSTSTNNLIIRNSARDNGTNYRIEAGNRVGVVVLPSPGTAVIGNSGGGLGTTDPWANFVY